VSFLFRYSRRVANHRPCASTCLFVAATGFGLLLYLGIYRDYATAFSEAAQASMSSFSISSPSFPNGGDIAKQFTCDGADVSPQLSWTDSPVPIHSFALLVDDPDAPIGNWTHWTMWNLPADARGLREGVSKSARLPDGSQQGINDFRKTGYNGPCPPVGKPHRYYFKLFALDVKLELKPDAGKKELEAAMKGHIVANAEWMGRYQRKHTTP